MDVVARACNKRSEIMLSDELGGAGLAALYSRGLVAASGQFLAADDSCVDTAFRALIGAINEGEILFRPA